MSKKRNLQPILLTVLLILVVVGIIFYFEYRLSEQSKKITEVLVLLDQKIDNSIDSVETSVAQDLKTTNSKLDKEIDSLDMKIDNNKIAAQRDINSLSNDIDQIEEQSNLKLEELKSDVSDIQVASNDFSTIVDEVLEKVVSVRTNRGQGSGAIISGEGYIVTNEHVVDKVSFVRVITYSGKQYNADIIGIDSRADIAVLKITAPNLESFDFGESRNIRVGEKVIAAGNPAGLSFTITEGIVSATRELANGYEYIQTDVPINPGNSGGPLVNIKGEIIGINNFKVSGFESLGFALASDEVKGISRDLIEGYEAQN